MSELDSLYSDSDWLDISSGRESDDNVSLSDQDSDRDEISSVPHSRRSSFSTESSLGGDVEAWEGFVSDSGEELIDALTGMYPVPLSPPSGTEPTAVGFIPNATEVIDPFVAEEDKRVKEALDQSFVGTLIASRSSAPGLHNSSAHTSIRDLRLSFPDPLTSRDDLNGSYQDVPSPVLSNVVPYAVNVVEPPAFESSSPPLSDQGSFPTPEVQRNESTTSGPDASIELDIILYGTSSSIKWQFVQDLIQKAISASGHEFVNSLDDGRPAQSLQFVKRSNDDMSFYETINVLDRTSEDSLKVETDDSTTSTRRSLAIVYLPTAELPALSLHDAFLPVLVPKMGCDNTVIRQAAEDDWDLLGVSTTCTLQLGGGKSSVIDSEYITDIKPLRVYESLSNIGDEPKKGNPSHKPLTEKIKSVNAVTLFGVMSVVMGFALNTMFQPSTPSPTPTINTPSSSNNQVWQTLAPPNRSVVGPSTGFNQVKENSISSFEQLALSIYDSRSTAISVTSPSSISLIVPSTSKAIAESASCSSDSQKASTDIVIRSSAVSLSKVTQTVTSLSTLSSSKSVAVISSAFPNSATLKFGKDAIFGPTVPNHLKSISEAFDATTKVLSGALGNDFADIVDAADDFLASFIEQTDSVIQQSKGKARALGEQIQSLNEEVVFRNERAKKRAKELKKKGCDIVRAAKEELKERSKRARQRARELKQTVVDNRNDALRVCVNKRVFAEGKKREDCEHWRYSRAKVARAEKENRRHSTGMRWADYRARRFPF